MRAGDGVPLAWGMPIRWMNNNLEHGVPRTLGFVT
jgi:hypothetical protein